MSLLSASTIVGEPLIQEINSDGTTATPDLFSRPSMSPPRIILIMPPGVAGYYASLATCRTEVSDRFV